MPTPLEHPWIAESDFEPEYRDSIRVAMKSTQAMLDSHTPPNWIITLDESAMWYRARTRIVVDGDATMDVEGNPVDSPVSTLLTDSQTASLLAALSDITPATLVDVEHFVLDGTWCVVTVANGVDGWCAFSQFNCAGMDAAQLALPGPHIATLVQSFYRSLTPKTDGP
ncbi:hypothetical protein Poly51_46020 [Rubripirellula tenax]|uniref:Uncharacterized protein n=1 Tax=Rubripirellula tenax TaxID=2528015 RepID=A0A5C6EM54_9BACT|nr:hypothetical protein [Rubripirellula tenax]TWU48701.1 hypothetical protein Poly51_46020 [Rubripirellula tenax]